MSGSAVRKNLFKFARALVSTSPHKAIMLLEAALQEKLSPQVELRARIKLGVWITRYSSSYGRARGHLERAQRIAQEVDASTELRLVILASLAQVYALQHSSTAGSGPSADGDSTKRLMFQSLASGQSLAAEHKLHKLYFHFALETALAQYKEGEPQKALTTLISGVNAAKKFKQPLHELIFQLAKLQQLVAARDYGSAFIVLADVSGLISKHEQANIVAVSSAEVTETGDDPLELQPGQGKKRKRSEPADDDTVFMANFIRLKLVYLFLNIHILLETGETRKAMSELAALHSAIRTLKDLRRSHPNVKLEVQWMSPINIYSLAYRFAVDINWTAGHLAHAKRDSSKGRKFLATYQTVLDGQHAGGLPEEVTTQSLNEGRELHLFKLGQLHAAESDFKVALHTGDLVTAAQALVETQTIYRDEFWVAKDLSRVGLYLMRGHYMLHTGDHTEAITCFKQAVKAAKHRLKRAPTSQNGVELRAYATSMITYAIVLLQLSSRDGEGQASELFAEAEKIVGDLKKVHGSEPVGHIDVAFSGFVNGLHAFKTDESSAARKSLAKAVRVSNGPLANTQLTVHTLSLLGEINLSMGNTKEASTLLTNALTFSRQMADLTAQSMVVPLMEVAAGKEDKSDVVESCKRAQVELDSTLSEQLATIRESPAHQAIINWTP